MDCSFTNENNWFRYRAAAIIVEENHVLVATNNISPYYYSVGGGVEMNETAEDAVLREVYEETGMRLEIDRLAVIHENFFIGDVDLNGLTCHEVAFYYLMKPVGYMFEPKKDSVTNLGSNEWMTWLDMEKLDDYVIYPVFFKDRLRNLSQSIEHIVTKEY